MTNEALLAAMPGVEEEHLTSQEIMTNLTDEERSRYALLQETFETSGWKILLEYFSVEELKAGIDGANAESWEKNREFLGRRLAWQEAGRLEETFMNAFESQARAAMLGAAQEEAQDDPEAE